MNDASSDAAAPDAAPSASASTSSSQSGGRAPGPALYDDLRAALAEHGPDRALDMLAARLEADRRYQELFELLVMKSRRELDLPLVQVGLATEIPDELVEPHERAIADACRTVGGLFLRGGDVGRAWPFLRAVGDTAEVHALIDRIEPGTRRKDIDTLIEIAVNERVHPRRGLELVASHYGICSAITNFEQFHLEMRAADRAACAGVLARTLYRELLENIRGVVEEHPVEGRQVDEEAGLMGVIRARPDLFEEDAYFIDTSHLWSVVRAGSFLEDEDDLRKAIELAQYGQRLSSVYQYQSEPPFEEFYRDHELYFEGILAAARGDTTASVEPGEWFVAKGRKAIADAERYYPMRALLTVLMRMGCASQAIVIAREFEAAGMGTCQHPSVYELCQAAADFRQLASVARDRDDPVAFAAGLIQEAAASAEDPAAPAP